MYLHTKHEIFTHHEEDAEAGQISEELFHTDRVGVKGKVAAYALVQLLHVLVHRRQFFILLPGMLAEAVKRTELREKREKHGSHTDKTDISKATVISTIMTAHKHIHLRKKKTSHCEE